MNPSVVLAGFVPVFAGVLLISAPSSDPRIASTDVAEVCASDGLPGSAYSRSHRVVKRHGRPGYELDHEIPICLGGADTEANLQWQPIDEALVKDEVERFACREVCRYHRIGLTEAQGWFTGDWTRQLWRIRR